MFALVVLVHAMWIASCALVPAVELIHALAAISAAVLVFAVFRRRHLGPFIEVSFRDAARGAAVGSLMIATTILGYRAALWIFPDLALIVAELYGATPSLVGFLGPAALVIIVAGEEVIWRALVPYVLDRAGARRWTWPAAIAAYGVAQVGHGSPFVVVLALVCGTIWVGMRALKWDLAAPLVAHTLWTLWFLMLFPLAPV